MEAIQVTKRRDWTEIALIGSVVATFVIAIVLPLISLWTQSLYNNDGQFVGLRNFIEYMSSPTLLSSLQHTFTISTMTMLIVVPLAFTYVYALTRTNMFGKGVFRYMALLPLFAPTMMHGIGLMYLFGNQGLITNGFFGRLPSFAIELYGPVGITMAEVIYTFPQAFLILYITLQSTDYRLYEAATTMGSSAWRKFTTITLPSAKYGIISSFVVVFTLSFTDYGAPKVIGGQYNVLATDVYQQVIGQQNFAMGATASFVLMLPAVIAFALEQIAQRRQTSYVSARSTSYEIKRNRRRDWLSFLYCSVIAGAILLVFAAVGVAAGVKIWPYNLSWTLEHFQFTSLSGDGFDAYKNSVVAALWTAGIGTVVTFIFACVIEKLKQLPALRKLGYFLSMISLALPGLVLGISYVFFFSKDEWTLFGMSVSNPFHFLYGTVAIIVLVNIVHFYSVSFVTATTALKKLDREFEMAATSMGIPLYQLLWRVTIPICLPAILEMAMYYFVNAMVTISAVVFLYSADFKVASISIVNMDDAGNLAPAAAMSVLIVLTNVAVKLIYDVALSGFKRKTSRWQTR